MRRIKRDLKEINAEFDFFGITKKFHLKKHGLSSFTELEYELNRFTNILKQEHFEPENQDWV